MKRPPRLALLVSIIVIGSLAIYWTTRPHLGSYRNSALAREVQPGATKGEIIKLLGDPIGDAHGWLLFNPSPNGLPIRAKFDSSGRIEMMDCGDGQVRDLATRSK